MGVYFVSREPVRSTEPLRTFAQIRVELERLRPDAKIAGSVSVPAQNRFAVADCPNGLGRAPESAIVEVYEYDPVRYQAMVLGLVEPPPETPIHWIARRVNPALPTVAVVPSPGALAKGVALHPHPRGYLGDTNTLLELGRMLKGREITAIERVGLVACAADGATLAAQVAAALSANG